MAFTPDGKRALSAGYDHEVALWDLSRGERVASFSFTAGAVPSTGATGTKTVSNGAFNVTF